MDNQKDTVTKVDIEIKLNLIDKMHATIIEISQARNRALVSLILTSTTSIAISLGLVSANQGFSFGGFQLSVSIWTITIVGAWLTLAFYIYFVSLAQHRDDILTHLEEEYKSLGFEKEGLWNDITTLDISTILVDSTLFQKTKFRRLYAYVINSIFVFIIIFIPLITDIVVFIKLINVLGWVLWGIIPLVLLFLISTITIVLSVVALSED